jgi:hypothetical protein
VLLNLFLYLYAVQKRRERLPATDTYVPIVACAPAPEGGVEVRVRQRYGFPDAIMKIFQPFSP